MKFPIGGKGLLRVCSPKPATLEGMQTGCLFPEGRIRWDSGADGIVRMVEAENLQQNLLKNMKVLMIWLGYEIDHIVRH